VVAALFVRPRRPGTLTATATRTLTMVGQRENPVRSLSDLISASMWAGRHRPTHSSPEGRAELRLTRTAEHWQPLGLTMAVLTARWS